MAHYLKIVRDVWVSLLYYFGGTSETGKPMGAFPTLPQLLVFLAPADQHTRFHHPGDGYGDVKWLPKVMQSLESEFCLIHFVTS